jgi:excisionase family DNA binding protein
MVREIESKMKTEIKSEPLRLLWTSREAAQTLCISARTLWGLTRDGKIRCIRIGRSVRYDPADIRAWIEAQKTSEAPESEPELP